MYGYGLASTYSADTEDAVTSETTLRDELAVNYVRRLASLKQEFIRKS